MKRFSGLFAFSSHPKTEITITFYCKKYSLKEYSDPENVFNSFYAFEKIHESTKLVPPSIEKLKSNANKNYHLKFSLSNGQFTGKI